MRKIKLSKFERKNSQTQLYNYNVQLPIRYSHEEILTSNQKYEFGVWQNSGICIYTDEEQVDRQVDTQVDKMKRQKDGTNALKLDVLTMESMQTLRQVQSRIKH